MRIVVPWTKEDLKTLKTIEKKIEIDKKWEEKLCQEKLKSLSIVAA